MLEFMKSDFCKGNCFLVSQYDNHEIKLLRKMNEDFFYKNICFYSGNTPKLDIKNN